MKKMSNDPLRQAVQHAYRYSYIDGSMEFMSAILCLALGMYFFIQVVLPEGGLFYGLSQIGLVLLVFAAVLAGGVIVRIFKEHITYPRTGFIAYRRPEGRTRWIRIVIASGVAMLIGATINLLAFHYQLGTLWLPALSGVVFSLVFLIMAWRTTLWRFYLLALCAILTGGGLLLLGVGDTLGLAYFYSIMAIVLLCSGAFTLWRYLRLTSLSEGDDEG